MLGCDMTAKTIGAVIGPVLGMLCASQAAVAQDLKSNHMAPRAELCRAQTAGICGDTLETGVARLAAKAAFSPSMQPSQQELLGILLVMSFRDSKGHGA